jgi:hypothetical protein
MNKEENLKEIEEFFSLFEKNLVELKKDPN